MNAEADLLVNSGTNRSILVNGVDILARLASLEAITHAQAAILVCTSGSAGRNHRHDQSSSPNDRRYFHQHLIFTREHRDCLDDVPVHNASNAIDIIMARTAHD